MRIAAPLPVVDVDLRRSADVWSLPVGASAVFAILRWGERVVGTAVVPLGEGRLAGEELRASLAAGADAALGDALVDVLLGPPPRVASLVPSTATVAVCTRDRPDDLARVLGALGTTAAAGHEILVVESGSPTEAARRTIERFPFARYVSEPRPGLDRARNRALRESAHPIVAFLDDDATPEPGWIDALLGNFDDRLVTAVTGLVLPLEIETDAQLLQEIHSPFGRGFRRRVLDSVRSGVGSAGAAGVGASMAFRREAVTRLGGFDEALDAGTPTRSGGDYEMFARILAAGERIVYEPGAVCRHRHRRTRSELRRAFFGYGVGVWSAVTSSLVRGEPAPLAAALGWLVKHQIPALVASIVGARSAAPAGLRLAELAGCIAGPAVYLASRSSR